MHTRRSFLATEPHPQSLQWTVYTFLLASSLLAGNSACRLNAAGPEPVTDPVEVSTSSAPDPIDPRIRLEEVVASDFWEVDVHIPYSKLLSVIEKHEKQHGKANVEAAFLAERMAILELRQGKFHDALERTRARLETLVSLLPEGDWRVRRARTDLSRAEALVTSDTNIQAEFLNGLTARCEANTFNKKVDVEKRADALRRAVSSFRNSVGDGDALVADTVTQLGMASLIAGDVLQAKRWAEEAIAIYRSSDGETHRDYFQAVALLATVHLRQKSFVEGRIVCQEGVHQARASLGDHHEDIAVLLVTWAAHENKLGNGKEAVTLSDEVCAICAARYGEGHAKYLQFLTSRGALKFGAKDIEGSEADLARASELWMANYGAQDKRYLDCVKLHLRVLSWLVNNYAGKKDVAAELAALAKMLEIKRSNGITERPGYVGELTRYCNLLVAVSDRVKAVHAFEELSEILRQRGGNHDPKYIDAIDALGRLHGKMGHYVQARTLLEEVRDSRRQVQGKGHEKYRMCLEALVAIYIHEHNLDAAKSIQLELRDLWRSKEGIEGKQYREETLHLAQLVRFRHELDEARGYARECCRLLRRAPAPEFLSEYSEVAKLCEGIGMREEASELLEAATERQKVTLGAEHLDVAASTFEFAKIRSRARDYLHARELFAECFAIREKSLGADHHLTIQALMGLSLSYFSGGEIEQSRSILNAGWPSNRERDVAKNAAYARFKLEIAKYCLARKQVGLAEEACREAIRIHEDELAKGDSSYPESLEMLDAIFAAKEKRGESEKVLEQPMTLDEQRQ